MVVLFLCLSLRCGAAASQGNQVESASVRDIPPGGLSHHCQLLPFQTQLFSLVPRQMESLITFYQLGRVQKEINTQGLSFMAASRSLHRQALLTAGLPTHFERLSSARNPNSSRPSSGKESKEQGKGDRGVCLQVLDPTIPIRRDLGVQLSLPNPTFKKQVPPALKSPTSTYEAAKALFASCSPSTGLSNKS